MNTNAFIASLVFGFLLSTPITSIAANVDPEIHRQCLNAADYSGCVKVSTFGINADESDALVKLRNAMRQVSSRLSSGTSLRDASLVFQPVIDAHAIVPDNQHNSLAYQAATLAISLFDQTRKNWSDRIEYTRYYDRTPYMPGAACEIFDKQVALFNRTVGKQAIEFSWKKKGLLGVCHRSSDRPEILMYNYTIGVLKDGATDPVAMRQYQERRAEAIRLANLGPWQRHLEKNPNLKVWAEANPAAAIKAQEDFNRKNPSDPVALPPLPSTMPYLQGSVIEKQIQ